MRLVIGSADELSLELNGLYSVVVGVLLFEPELRLDFCCRASEVFSFDDLRSFVGVLDLELESDFTLRTSLFGMTSGILPDGGLV